MRKKKCIIEGCEAEAKLMKISAWFKKPIEYEFKCEAGHNFTFTGYEEMWETPQGPPRGRPLRTPLTFPESFSGSTQWVES